MRERIDLAVAKSAHQIRQSYRQVSCPPPRRSSSSVDCRASLFLIASTSIGNRSTRSTTASPISPPTCHSRAGLSGQVQLPLPRSPSCKSLICWTVTSYCSRNDCSIENLGLGLSYYFSELRGKWRTKILFNSFFRNRDGMIPSLTENFPLSSSSHLSLPASFTNYLAPPRRREDNVLTVTTAIYFSFVKY